MNSSEFPKWHPRPEDLTDSNIARLMRELGPLSTAAPAFPLASGALAPLRAKAEAVGSAEFTNLWSGQAARLARAMPAAELTRTLAAEALARLGLGHR